MTFHLHAMRITSVLILCRREHAFVNGDNKGMTATDTQKNAVRPLLFGFLHVTTHANASLVFL